MLYKIAVSPVMQMLRHVESSVGERRQGKNKHVTRRGKACIVEWQVNLSLTPSFPVCTVRWLDLFCCSSFSCSCSSFWLLEFMSSHCVWGGLAICMDPQVGFAFFFLPLQLLAFIHIIRFPSSITGKLKCDCQCQNAWCLFKTFYKIKKYLHNVLTVVIRLAGLTSVPQTL